MTAKKKKLQVEPVGPAVVTFGPPNCPHCAELTVTQMLVPGHIYICVFCKKFSVFLNENSAMEPLSVADQAKLRKSPEAVALVRAIEEDPLIQETVRKFKMQRGDSGGSQKS